MISPVPSSINLFTPLLGHHPMVTSLLDQSKVIIRLMKDGNGKMKFDLGPIITMSCHPWDTNAKVEPSQHNEPPIPGPSPSSKPPEDVPAHEPEPEVTATQSMEELFAHSATPRLVIIIDNTPVGSPPTPPLSTPSPDLPPIAAENPTVSSPLVPSSSHSYNDALQEFTDLRPTLMIPQAIN
ncbi:hypothetical protein O181_080336 [Austropuccinia psidii MF-1]|uniref:Uncharacterized protein n=1 Tax=Austropuccinia psidii MF-1 TaxID=1389203 RepID=A0A9Q3FNK5_9BASI|nr:hypothetical protein [Austropuccinia psidii MF-1]